MIQVSITVVPLGQSTSSACNTIKIWDTQPEAVGAGSSWKRVSSSVGGAHKETYETPKSLSTLL